MSKRDKLLARARRQRAGWRAHEMEQLYRAWGFDIAPGGRDTKYYHPQYPDLVAYVTRSSGDISKAYVDVAVVLIDELIARGYLR